MSNRCFGCLTQNNGMTTLDIQLLMYAKKKKNLFAILLWQMIVCRGGINDTCNIILLLMLLCLGETKEEYAVEYALEYGFLRLSPESRKKLGIPVLLVELGKFSFFRLLYCDRFMNVLVWDCVLVVPDDHLSTNPSPKSTLTLTSHVGKNCDLREG